MFMKFNSKEPKNNVVDLGSFRQKKSVAKEFAPRGRDPLYVSHADGKVSGSPHLKGPEGDDFGDRLARIRTSLEKINRLMSELKRVAAQQNDSSVASLNSTPKH